MNSLELKRLRYRRQYVIAPDSIDCPFEHYKISLNKNYTLFAHLDLRVTEFNDGELRVFLLGDMFDFIHPQKNNQDILNDLTDKDYIRFLEKTSQYTGRFVLIYLYKEQFNLVTDATATRKVFYSNRKNNHWFASQSHLLAKLLEFSRTNNHSKLEFYKSEVFNELDQANIGNTTYYDETLQLMPNHYLNVNGLHVERFWPNERIDYRPMGSVASECADIVKGYMKAIAARYDVMMPVTAGNDTRLLLAGTRDTTENFFYYINKESTLSEKSEDIYIPSRLFKRLELDFHILELPMEINEDFKKIYFENNPLATERYLPHIYNYYLHFQNRVNLPGNFAAAPWGYYKLHEKNVSPEKLSQLYGVSEYHHAIEYYTDWLSNCQQLCKECNINVVRLFYWEERIANWGTQTQLDKDIAQEDINPFNSRLLLTHYLSVKDKYNAMPDLLLHRRIIKNLWPKLLKVPINPSRLDILLKIIKSLGLLNVLYKIRYKNAR